MNFIDVGFEFLDVDAIVRTILFFRGSLKSVPVPRICNLKDTRKPNDSNLFGCLLCILISILVLFCFVFLLDHSIEGVMVLP